MCGQALGYLFADTGASVVVQHVGIQQLRRARCVRLLVGERNRIELRVSVAVTFVGNRQQW